MSDSITPPKLTIVDRYYWVKLQDLPSTEKALLFSIVHYLNEDNQFWAAARTLAEQAGCSRKTVQRSLSYLTELELIKEVPWASGSKSRRRTKLREVDMAAIRLPDSIDTLEPDDYLPYCRTKGVPYSRFMKICWWLGDSPYNPKNRTDNGSEDD